MSDAEPTETTEGSGRPTEHLPARQLVRISLHWLGLSSIFTGLTVIMLDRLVFEGLAPDRNGAAELWFRLTFFGTFIAMAVQPTVGMVSDYTMSRWGRRKPYIFIGTVLDLVFLEAQIELDVDIFQEPGTVRARRPVNGIAIDAEFDYLRLLTEIR